MPRYPITPVAKPRMTRRDKLPRHVKEPRPVVVRYRAFADECRYRIGNDFDLNHCEIGFGIAMPKSWSDKKKARMRGVPHQSTPDLSNLLKALEDALYSKRFTGRDEDDSAVHSITGLWKVWTQEGYIVITRRPGS